MQYKVRQCYDSNILVPIPVTKRRALFAHQLHRQHRAIRCDEKCTRLSGNGMPRLHSYAHGEVADILFDTGQMTECGRFHFLA